MIGSYWDCNEQSGLLRSGKRYKRDLGSSTEYTPLRSESFESSEVPSVRNPPITPQQRPIIPKNLSQSKSKPSPSIPVAGQSSPASSNPSSSPRSQLAHVHDDIKLPVFKGTGSEYPEQLWFLCEAVWTAKNITDIDVRRAQLITSFRDRALTWFMKFASMQNPVLADIKAALIREFKKPKSELQCITELKEIQQRWGESVWDFDQRFKVLLDQVSFMIGPAQHKEWFIVALLPHIKAPLMQQKVADQ